MKNKTHALIIQADPEDYTIFSLGVEKLYDENDNLNIADYYKPTCSVEDLINQILADNKKIMENIEEEGWCEEESIYFIPVEMDELDNIKVSILKEALKRKSFYGITF